MKRIIHITGKRRFWLIASLPLQVLFFYLLSFFPEQVNAWYSRGIYPVIHAALTALTSWLPLPLGQVLVIVVAIFLLYQIVRLIFPVRSIRQRLAPALSGLLALASIIYFLFMVLWGINYHRSTLYETLTYSQPEDVQTEDLYALCLSVIQKANSYRDSLSTDYTQKVPFTISHEQIADYAAQSFMISRDFQPVRNLTGDGVKYVFAPRVLSYLGIGGIYFPFTGEANVNGDLPDFLLPFTTCHEVAHQIGYAREDEANYIGFKVCSTYPNAEFRYSAYLSALKYVMAEMWMESPEDYRELKTHFSDGIRRDLAFNQQYWDQFDTPIADYSSDLNDLFLKMNHQEEGTHSYGLVVDLLLAEYKKNRDI